MAAYPSRSASNYVLLISGSAASFSRLCTASGVTCRHLGSRSQDLDRIPFMQLADQVLCAAEYCSWRPSCHRRSHLLPQARDFSEQDVGQDLLWQMNLTSWIGSVLFGKATNSSWVYRIVPFAEFVATPESHHTSVNLGAMLGYFWVSSDESRPFST